MLRRLSYLLVPLLAAAGAAAGEVSPTLLDLNKAAFFYGREYFVLRSGRAQMVVQADRADLGPAFTCLLFDAQDAKQSARKESAFNFVPKEGFGSSAREVVLGGFPFTAPGHRTDTRWSDGGYDRYHTSGQPDQPGPWPFSTTFILRAQHDAGNFDRSRRALEWLNTCPGGRAGAWFEEISSTRMQSRTCGLVPWTSGEVALFVVRHYLGVRFERGALAIQPALYPGSPPVQADLRYRQGRLRLEISGSGAFNSARVNGSKVRPGQDGVLRLPAGFAGGTVVIEAAR